MRIYLASRYSRRREMLERGAELEAAGHVVTSRWIAGDHQIADDLPDQERCAKQARNAQEDFDDLVESDVIISFTEAPGSPYSRGGRHVELGIAIACGKRAVVVGHRENLFHYLPAVEFFPDWESARAALDLSTPLEKVAAAKHLTDRVSNDSLKEFFAAWVAARAEEVFGRYERPARK